MKTAIAPEKLYWASFNRFEMRLPGQAVLDCCHSGRCDDDVERWTPKIQAQVELDGFTNRPTPDKIRRELKEYGAWDEAELSDDDANWQRIVWIAAANISDDETPDCSEPIK